MASVAIIGDGPGGLSAALFLAKNGHEVTVFGTDKTAMMFDVKLRDRLNKATHDERHGGGLAGRHPRSKKPETSSSRTSSRS